MSGRWRWALAGAAAAALALGTAELLAGLLSGPSLVAAIGSVVIELQPPGAKDFMVSLFGTNDKLALEIATGIGAILIGAIFGLLARRDIRLAIGGVVAFGIVGYAAAIRDPYADVLVTLLVVIVAVGVGIFSLLLLLPTEGVVPAVDAARRRFLIVGRRAAMLAGGLLVLGGVGAVVGRYLGSLTPAIAAGPSFTPRPSSSLPPPPAGTSFEGIDGLSPIVVPNADFYRIDTRLSIPRLSSDGWTVKVTGLVNTPLELTYAQLANMPQIEHWITIACVSNEVGGELVGNAKWTGVRLLPILEQAGLQADATQVVGRSFDGFTTGFPTDHLRGAGSEAMIALFMNGEPLPPPHGFPLRLIVPGLYGYVSATKWLQEIELTRWEDFNAYWVPLGWSKTGPILTQSRIDVPRAQTTVKAGSVTVAGVAWAPTRGISKVEVQLDDGAWTAADLSVPLADTSWVQWKLDVSMPSGGHTLVVRATDGTGALQAEQRTPPAPDGARGWHQIRVLAS
jgi:DMSO/TMAO reductase YedYZ molybdopterin-dependent catalytic subunit